MIHSDSEEEEDRKPKDEAGSEQEDGRAQRIRSDSDDDDEQPGMLTCDIFNCCKSFHNALTHHTVCFSSRV